MLIVAMGVTATIVSFAFALSTFDRWLGRRCPHELAWTIAFLLFAAGATAFVAGMQFGWTSFTFRAFYLLGAILNVPVLALGQVLLIRRDRNNRSGIALVVLFSTFACGVLVAAPFSAPLPAEGLVQGSDVFGVLPRVLAAVGSGIGTLVLVGGTLLSAVRRRNASALIGHGLILGGAFVSTASGLLHSVLGELVAFAVTLTLGISLIFLGFLVLTGRSPKGSAAAPDQIALQVEAEGAISRLEFPKSLDPL